MKFLYTNNENFHVLKKLMLGGKHEIHLP